MFDPLCLHWGCSSTGHAAAWSVKGEQSNACKIDQTWSSLKPVDIGNSLIMLQNFSYEATKSTLNTVWYMVFLCFSASHQKPTISDIDSDTYAVFSFTITSISTTLYFDWRGHVWLSHFWLSLQLYCFVSVMIFKMDISAGPMYDA